MAYNYEIYFDHKNEAGKTRSMHMFNGPHDSELQPATAKMKIRLEHVEPSLKDPSCVRLSLTLTETP
jgi:hypothetical protein